MGRPIKSESMVMEQVQAPRVPLAVCVTTPPPPYYFRSKTSGLWSDETTWEVSTDNINWSNATAAPTTSDLDVKIKSPHLITLAATGITLDQTTIELGSTLEITGTVNIIAGTGADLTVNGILKNSGGTITTTGTISVESGGLYQHNPSSGIGTIPICTWQTGSTCEILKGTGSSGPGNMNQSYYNFTWNCSNQSTTLNLSGDLQTVMGTLTN